MDPRRSIQDVVRCRLCEVPGPPLHCDICQEYLCKCCVGEHLLDESKQHIVVPFKMRVLYPSCSKHFTQLCNIYCEPCNIPICAECVSSKDHLGHKQADILKAIDAKKETLQKDLKELENLIVPEYQAFSLKIPIQKGDISENSERVTTAIQKHGEYLHREIESAVKRMTYDVKKLNSGLLDVLNRQEDKINKIISEIVQSIAGLKKILKSNNVNRISAYKSRNAEFRRLLPHSLPVFPPCFTPHKVDKEIIFQQFGSLSYSPIKTNEHGHIMNAPGAVSSSPVRSLIDLPFTFKVIDTCYENSDGLCSVSCLSDDNIWTCGKDPVMRLYNLQGNLVKEIQTKSGKRPLDIAVTRSGDLVYSDFQDRTVNIVNDTKIRTMIKILGWRPCYICSTSYDDLLVVNISDDEKQTRIVRYSDSKEKQHIQYNLKGQPLFSSKAYPKYITENMNLDICVSDYYARAVVVVNQGGELKFTYHGAITKKAFIPCGITTDSQGQILTADCNNYTIHILDKDGHFLHYIDDNLIDPMGICVDTSDNLFIAENTTGKVKVIQY